jgi:dihydrofolate reductase
MISMISCMDKNRTIGDNNSLPWHLPADLKHFKEVTMGNTIVMGRKTYDSIGRALPGRTNVVLTRDSSWHADGVEVYHTIQSLLDATKGQQLFIIGGEQIYKQFMDKANKLYITLLDHSFTGDAFFPKIEANQWKINSEVIGKKDSKNNYNYKFIEYERL